MSWHQTRTPSESTWPSSIQCTSAFCIYSNNTWKSHLDNGVPSFVSNNTSDTITEMKTLRLEIHDKKQPVVAVVVDRNQKWFEIVQNMTKSWIVFRLTLGQLLVSLNEMVMLVGNNNIMKASLQVLWKETWLQWGSLHSQDIFAAKRKSSRLPSCFCLLVDGRDQDICWLCCCWVLYQVWAFASAQRWWNDGW